MGRQVLHHFSHCSTNRSPGAACAESRAGAPSLIRWMLCAALMTCMPGAFATTLRGMDIDVVVQKSELIFEGRVLEHNVQRDTGSGLIYTYVTFEVQEVIKGDDDLETLELRFTGGQLGDDIVEVTGLVIPATEERGIYFVESTSRQLVNPLLGWSQGHFLIVEDNDTPVVHTADRRPVTAIQPVAQIPPSIKRPQPLTTGESAAAAGVQTTDASALVVDRALSVEQFKARIRDLLAP